MSNDTAIRTTTAATTTYTASTVRQSAPSVPKTESTVIRRGDEQQFSRISRGSASSTTSLSNFSAGNLAKGAACVVLPAVGVIGLAALIARVNSPAALNQVVKGISQPGAMAKAFRPNSSNAMLYIGLGVTALFVGIYACQKH